MNTEATVFVIDDDPAVRESLTLLLEQEDLIIETFDSAESFLAACGSRPSRACAIVDIRMPGMDGMQLQEILSKTGLVLPIVFLTGHGDIPMSVQAIKRGAIDFLTKPITRTALLESVYAALQESDHLNRQAEKNESAASRLSHLTERERDVMELAIKGFGNKEIARHLGISHRTVEIHRARVMHKTDSETLLDLVRLAEAAGLQK